MSFVEESIFIYHAKEISTVSHIIPEHTGKVLVISLKL